MTGINNNRKAPQDTSLINITVRENVQYWADRFNVTEEKLRDIVNRVGPLSKVVEQQLRGRQAA